MDRFLYIVSADHGRNTYIPPHQHECYELVYYLEGKGTTTIGQMSYPFQANTFAFLPPRCLHNENHQEDARILFVGFQCASPEMRSLSGVYEDDKDRTIEQLMRRIEAEFSQRREGYAHLLNLMASEIAPLMLRMFGRGKTAQASADRVQYVRNYMDEHYRQKLSIEALARMSGYSYDRFRHLFRDRYGDSPIRYLLMKRLEFAKSLLIHSRMHISEVSSETGFTNDAQFCNLFKRETGMSPGEYRKAKAGSF
jgi:AraC-type DNA-binding domain-containing proteins